MSDMTSTIDAYQLTVPSLGAGRTRVCTWLRRGNYDFSQAQSLQCDYPAEIPEVGDYSGDRLQ